MLPMVPKQSNSNGLQPSSEVLHPNSDGSNLVAMASTLIAIVTLDKPIHFLLLTQGGLLVCDSANNRVQVHRS